MANAIKLSNVRQPYSDVVLGQGFNSDIGFAVEEVNLVKTATMRLGSILGADNTEAASAADAVKVLIWTDALFSIDDVAVGDTFTAVAARRDMTLNRFKLYYSNGNLIDDAGVEALADRNLVATEKVVFTS